LAALLGVWYSLYNLTARVQESTASSDESVMGKRELSTLKALIFAP